MYRPSPNSGYPILRHDGGDGLMGSRGVAEQEKLVQVRYNNDDRSVMKGVSADVLEQW